MIEPVNYWISIIVYITLLITTFNGLLKALGELEKEVKRIPKQLKTLTKFLAYSLTLVVPNIGIIWYFFYLAGFSVDRLSEARFFWAMVAQPTIGVSVYAYIWGRWLYPRLQRILNGSTSEKNIGKERVGHHKNNLPKKPKS